MHTAETDDGPRDEARNPRTPPNGVSLNHTGENVFKVQATEPTGSRLVVVCWGVMGEGCVSVRVASGSECLLVQLTWEHKSQRLEQPLPET